MSLTPARQLMVFIGAVALVVVGAVIAALVFLGGDGTVNPGPSDPPTTSQPPTQDPDPSDPPTQGPDPSQPPTTEDPGSTSGGSEPSQDPGGTGSVVGGAA